MDIVDVTATILPPLVYDSNATIVINKAPSYAHTPEPEVKTAYEVSSTYRQISVLRDANDRHDNALAKVKSYLTENYEELEDHADEIARLLNIDLTQYITFEMNVTITGTLSLPIGKSFDDVSEYDFDIDLSVNDRDIEIEDYSADIDSLCES